MLVQEPKSNKRNSQKQKIRSSFDVEEVDPNLHLPEDIKESKNNVEKKVNLNNEVLDIKSSLSIEILKEILRNNNSKEENVKINNLIEKIKEKNYYYVYEDINDPGSDLIRYFKQNENFIEKPLLLNPIDSLNYDIELYKIGKTCGSLKKRYAIIKNRRFYSSKKPIIQLNDSNKKILKDKTQYLPGSNFFKETIDEQDRDKREWSNKNKKYRIVIDYSLGHYDNSSKIKKSSFFLYFDDKKKMREVEEILFSFDLSEKKKKKIKEYFLNINNLLNEGNIFYTIMKILAVKNKIKCRKLVFNKINEKIHGIIIGKLNIEKKLLKRLSLQRKATVRASLVNNVINNLAPQPEPEPQPVLKEKPPKVIKLFEKQYSENMPLISNVSPSTKSSSYTASYLNGKQNSLNDIINKYNSLKTEIPKNIIEKNNELSEKGLCFSIPNGPEIIKNNNYDYDDENKSFKLDSDLCNNSKFIYFDKNKPEIIFKNDNNLDSNNNQTNILSDINIYEISNVILNSNININGPEDNNLVIIGPKIDNKKGISYTYRNKNNLYTDPEYFQIKKQIINSNNKEKINGTTIQIYQSELDMDNEIIKTLFQNYTNNSIEFNDGNLKDNILFSYKINLSPIKYIESNYTYPKDYKNKICFIEYNNQHFIPDDFFKNNSKLIIECFCLPNSDIMRKNKIEYTAQLLSPINIGYIEINYDDIKSGKYKYEIQNNENIIPNSFILLDGGPDIKNNLELKKIQGKDYSIGCDSYLEKVIDKDFIDKAKANPDIPEEIREKYFNVSFDSDFEKNFLFRPNENMEEEKFIKDISNKVSSNDLEKIKNNKKYNFLPYCEKYIDEKNLDESQNLKCLTQEQKQYIKDNYQPGDWIYKLPEIKVKLLSKNLGVTKRNNLLSQLLYSIGEEESLPLQSLNEYNENKVIPISENSFNSFDMKDMHSMENLDNFQWKLGVKFNNILQMESFVKLLHLARNNINTKKKIENIYSDNDFDTKKIFEFDNLKKNDDANSNLGNAFAKNKCEINIEFIEFREDFKLENDPTILEAFVFIEGHIEKTILLFFQDYKHGFKNSLLTNDEKIKNYFDRFNDPTGKKGKKHYFPYRINLDKNKFNNGQKNIILGDYLKTKFEFQNILNNNSISYTLYVILSEKGEYYTPLNMNEIMNIKMCNKLELPLYKKGQNIKIYGCIGIDLYELDNSDLTFQERYEELNSKYLNEPLLILKEQQNNSEQEIKNENYHFGLYEPNVFRRKILNYIHREPDIFSDPSDMENNLKKDMDLLYIRLWNKCVILPERENFSLFKFFNIRKNYSIGHMNNNSYRKKLGLKLLKTQRHEKFLHYFSQIEWDIYLDNIKKGEENLKGIDYYKTIIDKKILLDNKNEANKLHNLIYMGIPSLEYRKVVYSTLLEIINLYNKTVEVLHKKEKRNFTDPMQVFSYFANQLYENDKESNLIFSLIDNDCTFISSLENSSLEDINMVKKIAKSFFIWADLRIGLNKKEDKYVYFIGLLSITQRLRNYFQEDYFVFWMLVGLSQYIAHFHQQNPLFTNEMNYINIYGLVTKLILENHHKEIYNKFISLNFPPEFFLSRHLSTLYTDYFKGELMMRLFDILIFESSFQGLYGDNLQYLRILCAIPITLFELSKNRILACKSVSEIDSIFNDLMLHTFNYNKFIYTLEKNVIKFYVVSNIFEKWFFNNRGREWDAKRGKIQNLIYEHFMPVYKDNTNYLYPISEYLTNNPYQMHKSYFDNLDFNLNSIKTLYFQGTSNSDDSNEINGIMIHISNLQQIYNNNNRHIEEYKLVFCFGDTEFQIGDNYNKSEVKLSFDPEANKIKNLPQLFFKEHFQRNNYPKYIHFSLTDSQYNIIASFSYRIINFEPMKISKIILENKQDNNKYFLEFILFKYTTKILPPQDIALFNIAFNSPEYLHSKDIEEKLYSYSVSGYSFNRNITQLIKEQNSYRNIMINGDIFDENLVEMYKKLNNFTEKEDDYNSSKNSLKISEILSSSFPENIQNIINKWLSNSNISIEELFYSILLVDKTLITINEKLYLLYSIAQTKDKLLFNNDDLDVNKVKEMIYSLYKRFMIYFTKTDVERMIDFLLKDERLFNIKYVFVYNKINSEKIDEFIYDKDYYEPRLEQKKQFEIFFDDINKEVNIYLNHLNNHYNINLISREILIFILTKILNNLDLSKYIQHKFDKITMVIEKDNMIIKRNFNIEYSPLKIEEEYDPNFEVKPRNPEDVTNNELCYEISNLYLYNSYGTKLYISFDKFKEIFFKMPYLSDLFRVSFSYISENKQTLNKEFESFKVIIGYEDFYHGIFYFPKKTEDDNIEKEYEGNIGYDMNKKIKISDTVDNVLSNITNLINNKIKINNNENIIIENLKSFDKIDCYICYYLNENQKDGIIKEKIGYFDSLYSCIELKNKNIIEMQIIFNSDLLTFNSSRRLIPRGKGYCKIFYSDNNDFVWKKCKIKSKYKDISNVKLESVDYKTIPKIADKEKDVVLSFNI